MPRLKTGVLTVSCSVLALVIAGSSRERSLAEQGRDHLVLTARRAAATDLEIGGLAKDGPRYVSRKSLLELSQVEAVLKRDENFPEAPAAGVRVRGVEFGALIRGLGAEGAADAKEIAVEAVCSDGYTPTFPPDYMLQHHPILVLTIDGLASSAWAEKTRTADLGPYFVAYADFKPAFHVLSHTDRPQVPTQILRLEIATQERMFSGIEPPHAEKLQADSPVIRGYRIAQQNCFRCHSAAGYGGTKSSRDWRYLASIARKKPERFAAWVHNPQSIEPKSQMPPNLNYDRDTLAALTRYFAVFYDQIPGGATTLSSVRGD